MLMILSPAKNLDFTSKLPTRTYTQPQCIERANLLVDELKKCSPPQLATLMKISDKLAILNAQRFNDWQLPFSPNNARPAVLAFNGDVYAGLRAASLSEQDFAWAQNHLRILSGLYGVLRPLDLIQPYRLEMGTKLSTSAGNDLYQFWGQTLCQLIQAALTHLGDDLLINLASDMYAKAVLLADLRAHVVQPIFLDEQKGQFKIVSFYAKRARGLMARFIIKNRITSLNALKGFSEAGYFFCKTESTKNILVFKRSKDK